MHTEQSILFVGCPSSTQEMLSAELLRVGIQSTAAAYFDPVSCMCPPDCVLIYLNEKEISSARFFVQQEAVRKSRIIVLIDPRNQASKQFCASADIDDVIFKPVRLKELIARIQLVLSHEKTALSADSSICDELDFAQHLQEICEKGFSGAVVLKGADLDAELYMTKGVIKGIRTGNKIQNNAIDAVWRIFPASHQVFPEAQHPAWCNEHPADFLASDIIHHVVQASDIFQDRFSDRYSLNTVFKIHIPEYDKAFDSLPRQVRQIIQTFDGIRTFREVLNSLNLNESLIMQIVLRLLSEHLIVECEPASENVSLSEWINADDDKLIDSSESPLNIEESATPSAIFYIDQLRPGSANGQSHSSDAETTPAPDMDDEDDETYDRATIILHLAMAHESVVTSDCVISKNVVYSDEYLDAEFEKDNENKRKSASGVDSHTKEHARELLFNWSENNEYFEDLADELSDDSYDNLNATLRSMTPVPVHMGGSMHLDDDESATELLHVDRDETPDEELEARVPGREIEETSENDESASKWMDEQFDDSKADEQSSAGDSEDDDIDDDDSEDDDSEDDDVDDDDSEDDDVDDDDSEDDDDDIDDDDIDDDDIDDDDDVDSGWYDGDEDESRLHPDSSFSPIELYKKNHAEELSPEEWKARTLERLNAENRQRQARITRILSIAIVISLIVLAIVVVVKRSGNDEKTAQTASDTKENGKAVDKAQMADAAQKADEAPMLENTGAADVAAAPEAVENTGKTPDAESGENAENSTIPESDPAVEVVVPDPAEIAAAAPVAEPEIVAMPSVATPEPVKAAVAPKPAKTEKTERAAKEDSKPVIAKPSEPAPARQASANAAPKPAGTSNSSNINEQLKPVRDAINKKDLNAAWNQLQPLLRANPGNATLLNMAVQILTKQGDYAQAVAYSKKLESSSGSKASYWTQRAKLHKAAGQAAEASACIDKAIQIVGPDSEEGKKLAASK